MIFGRTRCWSNNPSHRPTADELVQIFLKQLEICGSIGHMRRGGSSLLPQSLDRMLLNEGSRSMYMDNPVAPIENFMGLAEGGGVVDEFADLSGGFGRDMGFPVHIL